MITALMAAGETLISVAEESAVVVQASCDQLDAAARHAQSWFAIRRCPDTKFGLYVSELISASRGICAIMQMVAREAPEGNWIGNPVITDKIATNLLDRFEQAMQARIYLRQWRARQIVRT